MISKPPPRQPEAQMQYEDESDDGYQYNTSLGRPPPLDPDIEAQLRESCAIILADLKPSGWDIEDTRMTSDILLDMDDDDDDEDLLRQGDQYPADPSHAYVAATEPWLYSKHVMDELQTDTHAYPEEEDIPVDDAEPPAPPPDTPAHAHIQIPDRDSSMRIPRKYPSSQEMDTREAHRHFHIVELAPPLPSVSTVTDQSHSSPLAYTPAKSLRQNKIELARFLRAGGHEPSELTPASSSRPVSAIYQPQVSIPHDHHDASISRPRESYKQDSVEPALPSSDSVPSQGQDLRPTEHGTIKHDQPLTQDETTRPDATLTEEVVQSPPEAEILHHETQMAHNRDEPLPSTYTQVPHADAQPEIIPGPYPRSGHDETSAVVLSEARQPTENTSSSNRTRSLRSVTDETSGSRTGSNLSQSRWRAWALARREAEQEQMPTTIPAHISLGSSASVAIAPVGEVVGSTAAGDERTMQIVHPLAANPVYEHDSKPSPLLTQTSHEAPSSPMAESPESRPARLQGSMAARVVEDKLHNIRDKSDEPLQTARARLLAAGDTSRLSSLPGRFSGSPTLSPPIGPGAPRSNSMNTNTQSFAHRQPGTDPAAHASSALTRARQQAARASKSQEYLKPTSFAGITTLVEGPSAQSRATPANGPAFRKKHSRRHDVNAFDFDDLMSVMHDGYTADEIRSDLGGSRANSLLDSAYRARNASAQPSSNNLRAARMPGEPALAAPSGLPYPSAPFSNLTDSGKSSDETQPPPLSTASVSSAITVSTPTTSTSQSRSQSRHRAAQPQPYLRYPMSASNSSSTSSNLASPATPGQIALMAPPPTQRKKELRGIRKVLARLGGGEMPTRRVVYIPPAPQATAADEDDYFEGGDACASPVIGF